MATSALMPRTPPSPPAPELVAGDRLTRDEFERRYTAMPRLHKAELIEGVVYVPSPVRASQHGDPHAALVTWLGVYQAATPGVRASDNATVRLDLDNEPQPDASLRLEAGGRSRVDADGYLEGAPELVAEITASTASYDLHDKLDAYRRNGVREYVVWRVADGALDWLVERGGRYEPLTAGDDRVLRSAVFPGLWLNPAALLAGDMATVLAGLQRGLATPEHAAFVVSLRRPRA